MRDHREVILWISMIGIYQICVCVCFMSEKNITHTKLIDSLRPSLECRNEFTCPEIIDRAV